MASRQIVGPQHVDERCTMAHHGTSRYDIDIDMMYFKICDFKDFQKLL
jgi:hypothetical protein